MPLDEAEGQRLAVRVTDRGVGISPRRAEADLPPLLPHPGKRRDADEGQRPGPLHRPVGREENTAAARSRRAKGPAAAARSPLAPAQEPTSKREARPSDASGSLSSRTSITWPKASGSTSRPKAYGADVVDTGEAAVERLLGPDEPPVRSRRARRDASRQGRLLRRLRAARGKAVRAGTDAHGARASGGCAEGICCRGRRLPAEANRTRDPARPDRRPAPAHALDAPRAGPLHVCRQDDRLRDARAARRRPDVPVDADGGEPPPLSREHEGKAVSRKSMLEDVWGVREDTDTRAIDNFIVRLRRYIERSQAVRVIC